jgi:hypothetical protein
MEETKEVKESSLRDELLEKINALNQKLDVLMNTAPQQQASTQPSPAPAKEVKINAY